MKARIKELAKQAGMVYDDPEQSQFDDFDEQKFAELIVKECGAAASEYLREVEGVDFGIADLLNKHFGVKL